MKTTKHLIFAALLALTTLVSAQTRVGIGIENPEGVLDVSSVDSGVILPRVANTASVTSPIDGMMVYDISTTCVKSYENGVWTDCLSAVGIMSSDCNTNGFAGTYTAGVALDGSQTFSVTITNNTSATASLTFQNSDVALSGVSGVTVLSTSPTTATISAGGSQLVTYTLSGIPGTTGTLQADWSNGTLSCASTITVN